MVAGWLRLFRMLHRQPSPNRRANWDEIKQLLKNRIVPAQVEQKPTVNPHPPVLFQMASAFWLAQAVYVAAKLGIVDLLGDGPQSSNKLAFATQPEPTKSPFAA